MATARLTKADFTRINDELIALRTNYGTLEASLADANSRLELARNKYRELLAENAALKEAASTKPTTGRAAGPRPSTYVPKAPDADTVAYREGMEYFRAEAKRTGKSPLISRQDAIQMGTEILNAR
jgi:hypothetical protein